MALTWKLKGPREKFLEFFLFIRMTKKQQIFREIGAGHISSPAWFSQKMALNYAGKSNKSNKIRLKFF